MSVFLERRLIVELKAETKFDNIELWIMDLASFDSVKSIKEKVDQLERFDILVENAALATLKYDMTPDGWERRFVRSRLNTI